jgi:hypothetical protein
MLWSWSRPSSDNEPHWDVRWCLPASEFDGVPDIIGVGTPCDQGGSSPRVGIPKIDASRCLITGVRGENETALQLCAELLKSVRIDLASVVDFELTRGCRQP